MLAIISNAGRDGRTDMCESDMVLLMNLRKRFEERLPHVLTAQDEKQVGLDKQQDDE